jgi:hypothetical protein
MSGRLVGRVLRESRARTVGQVAVEMVIAEHARDEAAGVRLGLETIAREARISTRQAKRYVAELRDLGEITVERPGHYGANTYHLHPGGQQGTPAAPETGDTSGKNRGHPRREQGTPEVRSGDTNGPWGTGGNRTEPGGTGAAPPGWSPKQRRVIHDMAAEHAGRGDPSWLERELRATANAPDQYRAIADHHRAWRDAGSPRPAVAPPTIEEQLADWKRHPRWQDGTLQEHELMPELWPAYRAHRRSLEVTA